MYDTQLAAPTNSQQMNFLVNAVVSQPIHEWDA